MRCNLKILIAFAILGVVSSHIHLESKYEKEFGWKTNCSWSINQTMEQVEIWRNGKALVVFKPDPVTHNETQKDGDIDVIVACKAVDEKKKGECIIAENCTSKCTDNLYNATLTYNGTDLKKITEVNETYAFVPLSKPVVVKIEKAEPPSLNCSAKGVPAPVLTWTIGQGKDAKKIDQSSKKVSWNTSSGETWSVLKLKLEHQTNVFCNAKQTIRNGTMITLDSKAVAFGSAASYGAPVGLAAVLLVVELLSQTNINL